MSQKKAGLIKVWYTPLSDTPVKKLPAQNLSSRLKDATKSLLEIATERPQHLITDSPLIYP
jgi:hypothetical protein